MTQALSVTQALTLAKGALEQVSATIVGEISEFSDKPGYKAVYFTLSDASSALSCLIWRSAFDKLDIHLRQGMLVEVTGVFTLYAAKGRMNFNARFIKAAGEGDLRIKVANLAKKLEAEGLMDPWRKKPVPVMPRRIAVVTSPRGKAIHDVLRTLRRRFPLAEVLIAGVAVEGEGAPAAIKHGLQVAQAAGPDVILLVRGGGSYEDLMPFNDEGLARAVAAGTVPIVTGIGHEPDTTIADMVGDVRASTPTAAAEHVVPDVAQLNASLDAMGGALANALKARMTFMSGRVAALRSRPIFSDASSLTSARELLLEQTAMRLQGSIPNKMRRDREDVAARRARLERVGASMLEKYRASMGIQAAKLQSLSPLAVLARGYSVTYDGAGGVVSGLDAVDCGDRLSVRVQDGYYDCTVDAKRRNP